jgi:predicted ATPase
MAARITRVRLKDFRSIADCDVALQPLTLMIGPNGSGKSNFLDSLRFIADSMHAPLEQVLEARLGIKTLFRGMPNGQQAKSFSINVQFDLDETTSGDYRLTIASGPDYSFTIEQEECRVGIDRFKIVAGSVVYANGTVPAFTGNRPALVAFGAISPFAPVFNLLANMTFCSPNPEKMRRPVPLGPGKVLSRDAGNAAEVLMRLLRLAPKAANRLNQYLITFNPEFREVRVAESQNFRWLAFVSANDLGVLNSSMVSDGTLRATGILLTLFQAHGLDFPLSLIGLEEPESNLHPAAAGVLLDALLEASCQVPVIASTHSADLLDRKDVPINSLLAVNLVDGETKIAPIDEAGRSILQEHLYTAGELLRMNQLFPQTTIAPSR